jgi:hypothetical protein
MSWFWFVDENTAPRWAVAQENRLNKRMDALMALVKVEQSDLDDLDAALDEATQSISDRIDALVAAGTLPDADVTALKADVDALRALSAPAPVEPPA